MRKISLTTIALKFFALLLRKAALNSGNYRIILKNRRTTRRLWRPAVPCGAVLCGVWRIKCGV